MGKRPFLAGILLLAAALFADPLRSEELPKRILNVRLAVDKNLMAGDYWRTSLGRLLRDAFFSFHDRFRICIKIKDMTGWDPGSDLDSCFGLLDKLESQVAHEGCDIVVGIASPKCRFGGHPGVSDGCLNYALVQYMEPQRKFELVVQHEICHLLGAIDLQEERSIMSGGELGHVFDDFTSRLILLNRNRSFGPASPLFVPEKRTELITLFKDRAALNREEGQGHAMLGLLYYEEGDYTSALEECARCLAIDPGSETATSILGHIYLAQGDFDAAVAHYRRILALDRRSSVSHFNLAQALLEKGETDEALAEFQETVKEKPDYVEAYEQMAVAYLRKGEPDPSIRACRAALALTADLAETWQVLAIGLILKWEALQASHGESAGIIEEAIASCRRSILLKPELSRTHNLLGIAYDHCGEIGRAEAEFLAAIELEPDLAAPHLNLAMLYFRQGKFEKSSHYLRRILEINPDSGVGLEIMEAVFGGAKRPHLVQ
jgi:tetratricopeptide (TPR) repeat protein